MLRLLSNRIVSLLTIVFLTQMGLAQHCPYDDCQNGGGDLLFIDINESIDYANAKSSKPFLVGVLNENLDVMDTSFFGNVWVSKISGPGSMNGSGTYFIDKYLMIEDLSFSKPGTYKVEFHVSGIPRDTITFKVKQDFDLCNSPGVNGCSDSEGNRLYASPVGIVSVDAVFPVRVGLIDSLSGKLDTILNQTIDLSLQTGPGNFFGTTQMFAGKWAEFTDLEVDAPGIYTINATTVSNKYKGTTFQVEAIKDANSANGIKLELVESRVYPNPGAGLIMLKGVKVGTQVNIYTLRGQPVELGKQINQNNQLDISKYANGVYYISVKEAGKTVTYKYIKK